MRQLNQTKALLMRQRFSRSTVAKGSLALMASLLLTPSWALNLRQAYEAAEQNDATIRASRASAQALREKLPQAKAQRLPNVSFSAGANRNALKTSTESMQGPMSLNNNYNSNNQSLQLRQPLYRPYISALVDQATAQVEDANATLDRDEQTLVTRVG